MWRPPARIARLLRRRFSSTSRLRWDEGDWSYAPEWWGEGSGEGKTVFRAVSEHGNGFVSVVAHPSSQPGREQWPVVENWLRRRSVLAYPDIEGDGGFKIYGHQWRVLRFNDDTQQSVAKVMAAYRTSDPTSLYLMQQPHCLAVPYLKSMVSAGLSTLASNFNLAEVALGHKGMNILCIGNGGGSLPLFLASKIRGAYVHVVEIDPVVVAASVEYMGFPASAVQGFQQFEQPADACKLLWNDIDKRLFLHLMDAKDFMAKDCNMYDLVFVDAYDGDDIFPHNLWDENGPFLQSLQSRVHPSHGTVVVNLHSDLEAGDIQDYNHFQRVLPLMGSYVSKVCRAYKKHFGFAFTVGVPWLCNVILVACRGAALHQNTVPKMLHKDSVSNMILQKSTLVEFMLDLPFPCIEYVKRGFTVVE